MTIQSLDTEVLSLVLSVHTDSTMYIVFSSQCWQSQLQNQIMWDLKERIHNLHVTKVLQPFTVKRCQNYNLEDEVFMLKEFNYMLFLFLFKYIRRNMMSSVF